ncbi:MAG: hypothetical protein J6J99_04605 [Oscillibacter sp.]|nr:hypothetical protein [Oscillibacter sp.]
MAEMIREYLDTVQEQIRWKRARPVVARELEQHLTDQRDAFLEEGDSPEEAERLAVEEMGDPVLVGTELDRVHRPKPQWGSLVVMALSLCVWLALRLYERHMVSYFTDYIWRFGAIVLLACTMAAAAYFWDYTRLGRKPMLLALTVLCLPVFEGVLEVTWDYTYHIGAYLAFLTPLALALAIYAMRSRGTGGLAVCCVLGLLPAAIWASRGRFEMLWPCLICNTALLAYGQGRGLFGPQKRNWLLVVGHGLTVLICILAVMHYTGYLKSYLTPPEWITYYQDRTRDIVAHAKFLGMAEVLPEVQEFLRHWLRFSGYEDQLLMLLGNFGWGVFLLAQAPMAVLLGIGWRKCRKQTAVLGQLVGVSILLTLTWQAVANVLQNFVGVPNLLTEFPYPLLTDGGTALVLDCALLGLLLSVFRNGSIVRESAQGQVSERKNFQFP